MILIAHAEPAEPASIIAHSSQSPPGGELRPLKARLVTEASAPGQSVATVARRHGICSSLLYRWRRAGDLVARRVRPPPPLIPVRVAAATQPDVTAIATERVERLVEITLPNGCSVRVDQHVDSRTLRRILAALRE
jgi:transposase